MRILTVANYSLNMNLCHRQHWGIWIQCVCLFTRWTVLWGVHGGGSEWRNAAEDTNREFGPHTHRTENSRRNEGQDLIFPALWSLKSKFLSNCAMAEWMNQDQWMWTKLSKLSTAKQRPSIHIVFNERAQTLKCKVCYLTASNDFNMHLKHVFGQLQVLK